MSENSNRQFRFQYFANGPSGSHNSCRTADFPRSGYAQSTFDVRRIRSADLGICHGGLMRIGRAIIIPAILALGVAGPVLASTSMPSAAGQVSNVQVVAQGAMTPSIYYHA